MQFTDTTTGHSEQLRQFYQDYVNELWIPSHLTPTQAEEFALDHFRRWMISAVEMLGVEATA